MTTETEIKLSLPHACRARAIEFFEHESGRTGDVVRLENIYFDTAELALSSAAIALRLRSTPGGWVQTLKTAGTSRDGVHRRGEWEMPLPERRLDLPALLKACDDASARQTLQAAGSLQPVFTTHFLRTLWRLHLSTTEIEAAIDIGEIRLNDPARSESACICEIELELKHGNEAVLYALAERLRQTLPECMPADISKAQRGYHLLAAARDARL